MTFPTEQQKAYWLANLTGGYTTDELWEALRTVTNPDDWRDTIDTVIAADEAQKKKTDFAITFYTATVAEWIPLAENRYRVISPGYRMGPAGP